MERAKAVVFIVIGGLALIGSLMTALSVKRFVGDSVVVPGRVSRLNAGGSHPEISFTTADGRTLSFPEGGWIGGYKAGESVQVRYRVVDPDLSAELDNFGSLWFWPLALGLFGLVFTLGGLLSFKW